MLLPCGLLVGRTRQAFLPNCPHLVGMKALQLVVGWQYLHSQEHDVHRRRPGRLSTAGQSWSTGREAYSHGWSALAVSLIIMG